MWIILSGNRTYDLEIENLVPKNPTHIIKTIGDRTSRILEITLCFDTFKKIKSDPAKRLSRSASLICGCEERGACGSAEMSVAWPELIDAPRAIALPQSRRPSADCQPTVIIRQATSVDSADLKRAHPFLGEKRISGKSRFQIKPCFLSS